MKSWRITVLGIICGFMLLSLIGCSGDQLRDRADDLESAADRIELVLETYKSDQVEESVLAQAVIDALPEQWQAAGVEAINTVGDVREASGLIVDKLNEAALNLDTQADKEASNTENAVFGVMSVADLLLGTNGLIAGIAGVLWKKKRSAQRVNEDIVTSIESSPTIKKAISDGGGNELRTSMLPETMRAIKKIKEAT
jgi:hypothetical protein